MNALKYILLILFTSPLLQSCIEDGISTSTNDQPTFSTDSLKMGMIFTEQGSTTHRFKVYNRHDKIISINTIAFRDPSQGIFRMNVDGVSGKEFHNVEIRPNDSIYVFVEATLPANKQQGPITIENVIDFTTLGQTRSVVVQADGLDVTRLRNQIIEKDTHFTAEKPYQIIDTLTGAPGVTLTIDPGATLYFHDKAELVVHGTLNANGTVQRPINMTGDRTGNVVTDISFDLMSGQWGGVYFTPTSRNNHIKHTSIRNTSHGVIIDSISSSAEAPALTVINSHLHNSAGHILMSRHSAIRLIGTELTDASEGIIYIHGGNAIINHCTIANYYLFSALGGPAIQLYHVNADTDDMSGLPMLTADFTNTIIYGNGSEISHGDLTGTAVTLRRCLLKSTGTDDDNFLNCLWDTDPLYYTVREEYIFDYRVKPESPVIDAGDQTLMLPEAAVDAYGITRHNPPTIGAYEFTPPPAEE